MKVDIQRIVRGHLDMYLPITSTSPINRLEGVKEESETDEPFSEMLQDGHGTSEPDFRGLSEGVTGSEEVLSEGPVGSEGQYSEGDMDIKRENRSEEG